MDYPEPARPFIKWVGGKTYLLPEIKKRIPCVLRILPQDVARAIREHAHAIRNAGQAVADQIDALTNPDGEVEVRVFANESR